LLTFESKPRWHDWGADSDANDDLDAAAADGAASTEDILGEDYDREEIVGAGRYSVGVESETPAHYTTMDEDPFEGGADEDVGHAPDHNNLESNGDNQLSPG
jgi:hypothetical protein